MSASFRFLLLPLVCAAMTQLWSADQAERPHYQAPTWKPRAVLPAADALRGDFWPASPAADSNYQDPDFDANRLSAVPAPGVHPRVLLTPSDVDTIRAKVALGDKAPAPFRVMWERVSKGQGAFYALVTKNDTLGKQLANQLADKIATLEPKLDKLDQQPDRDVLWAVERSLVASGDPNPPTEIWALLDYDYLHGWMTPEQRDAARRVIARLTAKRITNFMTYPDHFMINNHQGFGMEFIRLLLLIEGEPGFDQQVFDLAAKKTRAMIDWYLDKDGMCYESIKGWLNISAFTAVGLRQRDLLKHSHLRAKMDFFRAALRWENGEWHIRDEMRASAFHVIWMMHYYHPKDEAIDLLYRSTFTSHEFLTDAKAKWPDPVGIVTELLLLYADDGIPGTDGKPLDWTDQKRIDRLQLPITWKDETRGYLIARNSWQKDDLQVGFTCKQDFFYGGHEGSENNRLVLWGGGVNWIQDLNMLATKHTSLQNMVTIDGKGLRWPPTPGVWLGTTESPLGVTAAGDGRLGYSYGKRMQVHPLDFPSGKLAYYAPFTEGNFDLTRDLQVAFHPGTVRWNDGYAHTDYGPWSGETRLVEHYQEWNPMQRAYRTVQLARGEHPYVLVLDDLNKDDKSHLYEWNISLPPDCDVVEAQTPEILFQAVDPSDKRDASFLLGTNATARDAKTGRMIPKKGDPLCLVKVLWRNTDYGFPTPRFERFRGHSGYEFQGSAGFSHLTIPAISLSPEFRVLVYPHRFGDPLPTTTWNQDRSELSIQIGAQNDRYRFATGDGGRTLFAAERADKATLRSGLPPARPAFAMHGRIDTPADLRTTRDDGKPLVYPFGERIAATLVRPAPPTVIRYTLDGSEPGESSPIYEAPVTITTTCTMKARRFDPGWTCGPTASDTTTAQFIKRTVPTGLFQAPAESVPGLLARVYETKTVMWNDRGFFTADKVMMPDVEHLTAMHASVSNGFTMPHVVPQRPITEQNKGFYRWTGWFLADDAGTYEFAVDSCGPITVDVGGQAAIEHLGIFHQQQAIRRGLAILDRGWHVIDVTVCDPQFWNQGTLNAMPFSVTVRINDGAETTIATDHLRCRPTEQTVSKNQPLIWHDAATELPNLESGVTLSIYERDGRNRDPDYLDIDALAPVRISQTATIESNLKPGLVRSYDGWFYAPMDGLYIWDTPARRGESAGLGELRAAYQNQVRIDGDIVVQRGVAGRLPDGTIGLKTGWHRWSLRLGASPANATVTYPDGQTLVVTADLIHRPTLIAIQPIGATESRSDYEIYADTTVALSLISAAQAELRYDLDGKEPGPNSPRYGEPITISKTTTIAAIAFLNGKAITAPARVTLHRVTIPEAGLLAATDLATWDGKPGLITLGTGASLWIPNDASKATLDTGLPILVVNPSLSKTNDGQPKATDVNLTRGMGKAGFRLAGMRMRENAITVAVRFRSESGQGKLFGKDGYNAFGKSYKTVSCAVDRGGKITASPGKLSGGKIKAGEWHEVVLSGDEKALTLYLDGEQIASGEGAPTLTTDAFDCFSDHAAAVSSLRVYNRVLTATDVRQLFQAGSTKR